MSDESIELVAAIVQRAAGCAADMKHEFDRQDMHSAIYLTWHNHGLDLRSLLCASRDEFIHDAFGILNNLNFKTCRLNEGFTPRYLDTTQMGRPLIHALQELVIVERPDMSGRRAYLHGFLESVLEELEKAFPEVRGFLLRKIQLMKNSQS